jgi:hypothetical protein
MTKHHCPQCDNANYPRPTRFTLGDGITHTAPDIWLAGRSWCIERETSCGPIEAHRVALHQWAEQCELSAMFEAQQEARHAA